MRRFETLRCCNGQPSALTKTMAVLWPPLVSWLGSYAPRFFDSFSKDPFKSFSLSASTGLSWRALRLLLMFWLRLWMRSLHS